MKASFYAKNEINNSCSSEQVKILRGMLWRTENTYPFL